MALEPAVTDLELLKDHPALAVLLGWKGEVVTGAKFDRNELTIWIDPLSNVEALQLLRDDPSTQYNFLSDVTALDWTPSEPRFEVVYSLLSHPHKDRIRVKAKLDGANPAIQSVSSLWAGATPFEREVFDLFGIRFHGHPYLRRIMMPDDWEGHPLRKDYPVEGYR